MSKLLSDRIKKIPPTSVSEQRYQFIKLSETEPDLGVPPVQNAVLSSELSGTRKWLTFTNGFDINENDNILVDVNTVDVDTTGFINSQSLDLFNVLVDLDQAVSTPNVISDNTILGFGNSIEPLSIGQAVKPTDDVEFNSILTNSVTFVNEDSTSSTGKLQWNNQSQTLMLDLSPTAKISIGQQTVFLVKNVTTQKIPKGSLVVINGVAENDKNIIAVELWNGSQAAQDIIGFTIEDIDFESSGFVVNEGELKNVNTTGYTGLLSDIGIFPGEDSSTIGEVWDFNQLLYLTNTDRLTNIKPVAPANKTVIARVLKVHPQVGSVFVKIVPSSNLDNNDLAELNNLENGDIIRYNSATERFENAQQIITTVSDTPPLAAESGDLWWDTSEGNLYLRYDDGISQQWVAASIGPSGPRGFTGSQGNLGFTGSQGEIGEGIKILGSVASDDLLPPANNEIGDAYLINGDLWLWDGNNWTNVGNIQGEVGFTGSQGIQGDVGFTGSQGVIGFTGSQGEIGFTGSRGIQGVIGFTGSQGEVGFTGSSGEFGFTGSQGEVGFTGSQGDVGFTGSQGDIGPGITILGSLDNQSELPTENNQIGDAYLINGDLWLWDGNNWTNVGNIQGEVGFTGSKGEVGFTGSKGEVGFTGSKGEVGFTGSQGDVGPGIAIKGSLDNQSELPTENNQIGDAYLINGDLWLWDGNNWTNVGNIQGEVGFTGSKGEVGFTGSKGEVGFTGSKGEVGFTGSQGDVGPGIAIKGSLDNQSQLPTENNQIGDAYLINGDLWLWDGNNWTNVGNIQGEVGFTGSKGEVGFTGSKGEVGFTGSKGEVGFTGSQGDIGPGIAIKGSLDNQSQLPTENNQIGDAYLINGDLWLWDGNNWTNVGNIQGEVGFTGSKGEVGFTGSKGDVGFTGSQGDVGFTGSQGDIGPGIAIKGSLDNQSQLPTENNEIGDAYLINGDLWLWTGDIWTNVGNIQGEVGFTGSKGDVGFTGSKGEVGFTGSQGDVGFTGSQGDIGPGIAIKGSLDNQSQLPTENNEIGDAYLINGDLWLWTGDIWTNVGNIQGEVGFTGSKGDVGFTGSKGEVGFTGSKGEVGFTGSQGDIGPGIAIKGSLDNQSELPTENNEIGDAYLINGDLWLWDGNNWTNVGNIQGEVGFTGSKGDVGFTGSKGDDGPGADIVVTNDTTTNDSRFITFVASNTGSVDDVFVSSSKLFFNPSTGQLNATEFNSLSDIAFKQDIEPIERALEIIKDIQGFSFRWKENHQKTYGFIAQNLEKTLPEAVSGDKVKSVNYNAVIPVMVEAIKRLIQEIEDLKNNKK
jgi:hypothetical protein